MLKGLLRVFAGFGVTSALLAPLGDKAIQQASLEISSEIEKLLSLKKPS
jgi:hypothetical protein